MLSDYLECRVSIYWRQEGHHADSPRIAVERSMPSGNLSGASRQQGRQYLRCHRTSQKPGKYALLEGMRIVDALKTAGDLLEDAQVAGIKIIRRAERKSFNYAQFAIGKRTEQNILLESGDVIVVP